MSINHEHLRRVVAEMKQGVAYSMLAAANYSEGSNA